MAQIIIPLSRHDIDRSDTLRQNLDISVTIKRLEIFLEYM